MPKIRNKFLDCIKFLAAISVVLVHCNAPDYVLKFQFAVPLFFIISGYFSYNSIVSKDYKKMQKKSLHILKLFTVSYIGYLIFEFIFLGNHENFYNSFMDIKSYIKLFVFNCSFPVAPHLWFLLALFYVYVLFSIPKINNMISTKRLIFCIIALLSINYLFIIIGNCFGVYDKFRYLVRNWIFIGIPCFSTGVLFKEVERKKCNQISSGTLVVLIFISIGALLTKKLLIPFSNDFSISTFIIAASLFLLSFRIESINISDSLAHYFDKISKLIYVVHWEFIGIVNIITKKYELENIMIYLCFPIVLISTILFSSIIYYIIERKKVNETN